MMRLGSLEEMLKASREEASRLQEALHSLDRQRDTVQDELDVKTETLFQMKKEKQLQVETEQHLQANIRELHSQLSARENLILSKDQEISSLRHQLDASSAQFKEACHGREIAIADNRRLQRDLKTMTQENQTVHHELSQTTESQDQLKLQVQQYAQQVVQYQTALDEKVRWWQSMEGIVVHGKWSTGINYFGMH
jgi:centrosomal protein CEP135